MRLIISIIKKDIVLSAAIIFALLSMFFVKPDRKYLDYIDFRTVGLLFSLMAVVAGFTAMGVMRKVAEGIISRVKSTGILLAVLWGLCFFSSMIITNDVSLITFVPLAISVLTMCNKHELIIYTVVLQTVAANLGSMLTPMGNPQNLYIFNYFNLRIGEFLIITLPVIAISFVMLLTATLFVKNESLTVDVKNSTTAGNRFNIIMYSCLGMLCILAVLKVIDYRIAVVVTAICLIIFDRKILKRIDWLLLITFCAFFIFVGNIERIEMISNFINGLMTGREIAVSLCASQFISNVPAAVMLCGFTDNYRALILGTDIGGLGTLIASLASLISFKIYSVTEGADIKRYLGVFTLVNIVFLVMLVLFTVI